MLFDKVKIFKNVSVSVFKILCYFIQIVIKLILRLFFGYTIPFILYVFLVILVVFRVISVKQFTITFLLIQSVTLFDTIRQLYHNGS